MIANAPTMRINGITKNTPLIQKKGGNGEWRWSAENKGQDGKFKLDHIDN